MAPSPISHPMRQAGASVRDAKQTPLEGNPSKARPGAPTRPGQSFEATSAHEVYAAAVPFLVAFGS